MGPKRTIIFILALLFSLLSSSARSEEYGWGAVAIVNHPGWQVVNSSYSVDGDTLVLTSDAAPRIVSPPLNIPASSDVLEIRLTSPSDGVGALGLGFPDGSIGTKYFKLRPGKRDYRLYLGDIVKKGRIQGFVVEFHGGEKKAYRLESIRFFKPSVPELLRVFLEGFSEPDIIKVSTINSVTTPAFGPLSLMALLYMFIIILTATLVGVRLNGRKPLDKRYAVRAVVVSFFIGAVVLTVRMDYNWAEFWAQESRTLSGKSVAERIREVNGPEIGSFLMFIDFVKKSVPDGKSVAPATLPEGEQLAAMARYYLLPVKTSSKPDYLWLYNEAEVYYDPMTSSLKKNGVPIAAPVRPFKAYTANSAVYELIR
ncbi:MAG: hypothetical protein HY889_00475 [Deltaproteobacteria bacterium]|nr:hypothetical protein [Deltaproteobacteria bacterium]